jgi:hypothetical protein
MYGEVFENLVELGKFFIFRTDSAPLVFDLWKLPKCEIIDTKEATDHNIVFAELELRSK